MQTALVGASTVVALISPITYVVSIIRGNAQPHRMTRFALMVVLSVNFASIVVAHGNFGAKLLAGIFCVQSVVILGLSLWRGMGGTAWLDWACLGVALIGSLVWWGSHDPIIGTWTGILGDFAAYVPAFVKTWQHPKSESPWFYLTSALAALLTLVAYPLAAVSAFQIYIILCGLTMTALIYRRELAGSIRR